MESPTFVNVVYKEFTPLKPSAEIDKAEILDELNKKPEEALELAIKYGIRYNFGKLIGKNNDGKITSAEEFSLYLTPRVMASIVECHYSIINDRAFLLNPLSTPQFSHDSQKAIPQEQ